MHDGLILTEVTHDLGVGEDFDSFAQTVDLAGRHHVGDMVGVSPAMQRVYEALYRNGWKIARAADELRVARSLVYRMVVRRRRRATGRVKRA